MHKNLLRLLSLTVLLAASSAHASVNSDFPVFWVAGDPNGVAHAFRGVAAFFGNGNWAGSIMAGGMTAAALVGLLLAIVSSALRTQFMVGQWFVGTVIAMAMFTPTTTVTIKSFFDENSATVSPRMIVVENVPYGIAFPAGMASYASKTMGDTLMTWFTNPDETGGALAEGASGLMSPLKLLTRLNGLYDCSSDHATICNNAVSFFNQCKATAATAEAMREQGTLRTLFEEKSQSVPGYMEYRTYNPANTDTGGYDSVYLPCKQGAQQIWAAMQAYLNGDGFAKDVLRSTASSQSGGKSADNGGAQDLNAMKQQIEVLNTKLQNVLADVDAANNDIVANATFHRIVRAALNTAAEVSPAQANRVFVDAMLNAKRKAAADQAGQASLFISFMTQAMNAFSFLFAATAPIIVLVAMVMGLAGFKVYGSWLLFGVWSQSWLPIAALVSYYVESDFWRRLQDLKLSGQMALPYIDQFYDQATTVLYTGSTLMSAVPIITLSLISGSMYAMTNLAGKSTGTDRDYVDEKRITPTSQEATNSDHIAKVQTAGGGMHTALAGSASGMLRQKDLDGSMNWSAGNQLSMATARVHSAESAEARSWSKVQEKKAAVEAAEKYARSDKMGTHDDVGHKTAAQSAERAEGSLSNDKAQIKTYTSDVKASTQVGLGLKTGGAATLPVKGTPVGGGIPSASYGAGGEIGSTVSTSDTWTDANQKQTRDSRAAGTSTSLTDSAESGSGVKSSTDLSHDRQVSSARAEYEAAKAEHSKNVSERESAQREMKQAMSYGADLKANIGSLTTNAFATDRAQAVTSAQMGARAASMEGAQRLDDMVNKHGGWGNANAVQIGVSQALRSGNSQDVSAGLGAAAALAQTAGQQTVADAMRNEIAVRSHENAVGSQGTAGALGNVVSGSSNLQQAAKSAGVSSVPGPVTMPRGIGGNPFGGDPVKDKEIAAYYNRPEIRQNGRHAQEVKVYDEMVQKGISPSGSAGQAILNQAKQESAAMYGTTRGHHERSMKATERK
ncbi:conjugal transfer protein TraG N-terminal domain-containing protein [Noviherbaspirillum galbum]|uniref:Conjugal transfer protein TraG n=1 Tax=Noviherbaspirillum galbum TaxID=2709383 RepID=A0A6B3SSH4_9BURK|nr:conjugal transfer protein TraG N-terminal domain-containing protein [Noviherbaspirillum galbum]NEX63408.1 conjugal transfer protein TraG [Noviherbaspirillum galbum]